MELHLQLNELANALADCGGHQAHLAKLRALLDATGEAITAALKIPSRDQ
jgi:hypothetical protein